MQMLLCNSTNICKKSHTITLITYTWLAFLSLGWLCTLEVWMYVSELISWKGGCCGSSSVQCTAGFLHAYGVNVAANEDAGSVVRGARTHASEPNQSMAEGHTIGQGVTSHLSLPLSWAPYTAVHSEPDDPCPLYSIENIAVWLRNIVQRIIILS